MATMSARMDNNSVEGGAVPCHKRSMCEAVPEDSALRELFSSSATTTDSAVSSTDDPTSRRSSSGQGFGELRPRRSTISCKMPVAKPKTLRMGVPAPEDITWRKVSKDSQLGDEEDSDDGLEPCFSSRRMSVDERTLRSANYAILRKNFDRSFEIVGAFSRHQKSAYRSFLHSLTAYDIVPTHGILFMIDSQLSIRKTIHAMCAQSQSHRAAIVHHTDGMYRIFTLSDFLCCLQKRIKDPSLGDKPVWYFFDQIQTGKMLVTASCETSVWDLAHQFRLNHVHRIPIMQVKGIIRTNELLGLVSLRPVFMEIYKLVQTRCCLTPNLNKLSLKQTGLGKWKDLATLSGSVSCREAVDYILQKKVACLPLLDENDFIKGVFCKYDVLAAVTLKGESGIDDILNSDVEDLLDPSNMDMLITPDSSISDVIKRLTSSQHQCLFISQDRRLLGVVSYADIMDFVVKLGGGHDE